MALNSSHMSAMSSPAPVKTHSMCSLPFRFATLRNLQPKPRGLKSSLSQADALTSFSPCGSGIMSQTHRHSRRPCLYMHAKGGSNGDAPPADPAPAGSVEAAVEVFGIRPAWMTLLGVAAFSVIASDVFLSGSPHLLAPVDTAVASWVETNMPVTEDGRFVAKSLSNLPITLAMVGIGVTSLASGLQRPRATLQRLAAVAVVFTAPGWTITSKDFPVIDVLKNILRSLAGPIDAASAAAPSSCCVCTLTIVIWILRNRPAFGLEHSSTFSFPSGHTFVCLFFLGTIAIMAHTSGKPIFDVKPAATVTAAIRSNTTPLMCLAAVTATGRVLSDVHWVSDTVAGAAAATTMLGLTLMLLGALGDNDGS